MLIDVYSFEVHFCLAPSLLLCCVVAELYIVNELNSHARAIVHTYRYVNRSIKSYV